MIKAVIVEDEKPSASLERARLDYGRQVPCAASMKNIDVLYRVDTARCKGRSLIGTWISAAAMESATPVHHTTS